MVLRGRVGVFLSGLIFSAASLILQGFEVCMRVSSSRAKAGIFAVYGF